VHHLAAPRHERHRSGNLAAIHVALNELVDPFEPLARHAHRLCFRNRQVRLRCRAVDQREGQQKQDGE